MASILFPEACYGRRGLMKEEKQGEKRKEFHDEAPPLPE